MNAAAIASRRGGDMAPIEPLLSRFSQEPDDPDDGCEDHFVAREKRQPEADAAKEQRRHRRRHRAGDEAVDTHGQPERDQWCVEPVLRVRPQEGAKCEHEGRGDAGPTIVRDADGEKKRETDSGSRTNELPNATSAFANASGSGSRLPLTFGLNDQ